MTTLRVALLTIGDPHRMTGGHLFHRRLAEHAAMNDAELTMVSIPGLPLPWALAAGPTWLARRAVRSSDVVVLDSLAAAAAAPWLQCLRQPVLGMAHQTIGGLDTNGAVRGFRSPFDRWAYRTAVVVMAASEWLAAQLQRDGIPHAKLRVLMPGKDAVPDAPRGSDPELQAALRGGRLLAALCVANWLPHKGIAELVDAVARLPEETVTLHLVGDTVSGGTYARAVAGRIASADLRDRVVVHGVAAPEAVARMYPSADVCVLPSFEESYGTVWGEAMAAGLPVIGWRAANLPFLVDHAREGLLVPSGDVDGLAGAIEQLARDAELRTRLGTAAAARASGRPTWAQTAEHFFAVARQVASSA